MFPPGYEPFLRAICATPADDAPRLVFADWLDENGEERRAEFIRLQIALYRGKENDEVPEELAEQLRPLRELAELTWRPQLPRLRGVSWQRYWRGFISGADFHSAYWFFKQSTEAFETIPLQFMRIHGLRPAHAEKFAACELLNRLEGLTLMGEAHLLEDKGWRALTQSPHLGNLRTLHVHGTMQRHYRLSNSSTDYVLTFSERVAQWIVDSPVFDKLEDFGVGGYLSEPTVQLLREHFGNVFRYVSTVIDR